ncbi:hypothetical protein B0J18DRAFT_114459 [Chaetomium sp. MPI-SDFR-AT-0129]|nr:hypothetical protein B0J18DRAFT_114459 [Chaetomium sp. MPI-SDFR-AT-0129]
MVWMALLGKEGEVSAGFPRLFLVLSSLFSFFFFFPVWLSHNRLVVRAIFYSLTDYLRYIRQCRVLSFSFPYVFYFVLCEDK